ncbi:MAG: UDP-N-acetylmuramoyl-tripeptide--D-alanyl-D-alanine ligase [Desulfohalobiaceae bacterium]|nr:UDP-N-acetylmuramoyl-tripeptide--D-alanyl-D-alanine ligase [Desulfohalobiaceae bacterium]
MRMSLSDIAGHTQAVGDYALFTDLMVTGVKTDSRLVVPGDLFVCLPGQRFDGHQFAWEAVHRGASALLVERPLFDFSGEVPVLLVKNTLRALGQLAAFWRSLFQGRVLGVTGSAGKTSVKEFLSSMLKALGGVGKNYKNWNNELGLSLSILGFTGNEKFWVLEAGISENGEMDVLGRILRPDLAVIVNIGPCHLQGLGDLGGVAREKGRLLSYLTSGGTAVLGTDCPELLSRIPDRDDIQLVGFSSRDPGAAYFGDCLESTLSRSVFSLRLNTREVVVEIGYPGRFMLENVLAAATAADTLDLDTEFIQAGLSAATLPEHRCQVYSLGGYQIIDDCYNANPLAMQRVITDCREMDPAGPLILVLGEMKELGAKAPESHRALGELAAGSGCRQLIYFGNFSHEVKEGFVKDRREGDFVQVSDSREFLSAWKRLKLPQGTALFKASRGCGLEKFVTALVQELS